MNTFYTRLNNSRLCSKRASDPSSLKRTLSSPALSQNDLDKFRRDLQAMFLYIKQVSDENPGISNEELKDEIKNFLLDLNYRFANSASFKSDSIRLDMCRYFNLHMSEFTSLYKSLIKEEKESGKEIHAPEILTYSANTEVSKRYLMEQLITSYRNIKKSFEPDVANLLSYYAKATPKARRDLKSKITRESREFIEQNTIFFEDEQTGIEEYFKNQNDFLYKCLKQDYITFIISLVNQLEGLNLLDKYRVAHNNQFINLGLPKLAISEDDFKDFYGNLTQDNLQRFNIYELSVIHSFWINRLSKEILSFNDAFFTISELNLWDEIRNTDIETDPNGMPYIDVQLSDKQIEAAHEKMRFLSQETTQFIESLTFDVKDLENASKIETQQIGENLYRTSRTGAYKDLSKEIETLDDEIGKDYRYYFSRTNGGVLRNADNDFFNDFALYHTALNITHTSYKLKDNILIALLSNLFNNNISKNWGLSLENKRKNPINQDKVLIAVDMPGFNMPIRLHMRRELLEDFLKANQNTTRIPLYQGENDFLKKQGSVISTPMLMPLSSSKKKELLSFAKSVPETHPYYKFIKHLEFIINSDSYPEHLKVAESYKGKKSNGKKKFIHRYYDFSDGKIYYEKSKNNFVEDTEYISGGKSSYAK